jgi:3-dehydroquinate synthase
MTVYLQKLTVPFEYPVCFTRHAFACGNHDLADAISRKEPTRRHRVFAVVERAVAEGWPRLVDDITAYAAHHFDRLELVAPPHVVEGGEAVKNDPAVVPALQTRLHDLGLDRHAVVMIVGGGALLDMAGYVAGIVHRGIRVVRVPTTVLAQDDSGVGVKNGVNAYGKKNFLGTFAPPFAVVNDLEFLATLPRRDAVAGMAEAVKVSLIRDAAFFEWIAQHATRLAALEPETLALLVQDAAILHMNHIASSGDPFEMGSARPLDFGHWSAHKLESMTQNRLRHGEAVAIGVALDTIYSVERGLLAPASRTEVLDVLETLGLPLWAPELERRHPDGRLVVLDGLAEFREHLGGELTVTLLAGIGHGVEVHEMDETLVGRAIEQLRDRRPDR